ncbi:DNA-methyltransferase [Rathayibacter sp. VKM Ac-2630]|uniref:DNA-methyltransferase n=1 Tax=Rathayibacter sp. VKM Ac-2630 TaxID=1938617 RepID=UPI00191C56A9|nr:site-specific DNA-methyltransferase [Rathayibacter sp. VKM Ac-2630]
MAKTLPPRSVQTIVTSPPYFGLRDYGEDGQIGAEQSVEEYVAALVAVFAALRDVLADDGTLWLNLGDSYAGGGYGNHDINGAKWKADAGLDRRADRQQKLKKSLATEGITPKNLIGIPWRVAFALQADGWILRSEIIWAKKNVMPESVTDRPTKAHEHIFLLAKNAKYYYDAKAIREEAAPESAARYAAGYKTYAKGQMEGSPVDARGTKSIDADKLKHLEGRNKRDVWHVATTPFPGAHFATYPPDLIRPCILAGSRVGDTVLDPFSGSGTTGQVALQHGRKYVGIDISREYLDLSLRARFQEAPLDFGGVA